MLKQCDPFGAHRKTQVTCPSEDQLCLEQPVLSSMVHVRWPLIWRGPERTSSLLPNPVFSTEGISFPLCRRDSWATRFLCCPISSWVKASSSCRGKIGVLRLEKEQQLWGKMLAMCKADQGLFWRKNVLTQDFHEKKVTEEHGMQRPEAVHRSSSVSSFCQNEREGKYSKKSEYPISTFFQSEMHLLWK